MRRFISMLALTCITPAALFGQTQGNWTALGAGHGTWVGAGYGKREIDPASVRVLGPDYFVATTRWRDGNSSTLFETIEYDCVKRATRWIDSWRERGSQRISVQKTPGSWGRPALPGSPSDRMITAACDYVRQRGDGTGAPGR
jgi:hypothetical protein